jgi:hypothetical protein
VDDFNKLAVTGFAQHRIRPGRQLVCALAAGAHFV